jgi:hypothetical protein
VQFPDNIAFRLQRKGQLSRVCSLVSFAEKEPTLEDVFMMVTKGLVT